MVHKTWENATDSPYPKKTGFTEIDSSPPFQSVKDAIAQFDEGSVSEENFKKVNPHSPPEVEFDRELELQLALKELDTLKEQLKEVETTKAEALVELEKAKRTVHDFTQKLKACGESTELEMKVKENVKRHAKQLEETNGISSDLKEELEAAVKRYASVVIELVNAKHQLWKMRQEYDSAYKARFSSLNQVKEEEDDAIKMNTGIASELSKEIPAVEQVEAKDVNPELTENLEAQLAKTLYKISTLHKKMKDKKNSELDYARRMISELNDAKRSLQKVAEEKTSLRNMVETLKLELEKVKGKHSELKGKESETESIVGNLHAKLRTSRFVYGTCFSEESKVRGVFEEMITSLNQLLFETENGQQDVYDMKNKSSEIKKKAEVSKLLLEDAEKKFRLAQEEAATAKATEAYALYHIKDLPETTSATISTTSGSDVKVRISAKEFELIRRKVEGGNKLLDMKLSASMAKVKAVKASENEALMRIEATQKEINDMKTAIQETLKRADSAEAATMVLETELYRCRQSEKKKSATQIFERQMLPGSSTEHYGIQNQTPPPVTARVRNLEKKISGSKKISLLTKIRRFFCRKRKKTGDKRSVSFYLHRHNLA